jgi:hypothetical protein
MNRIVLCSAAFLFVTASAAGAEKRNLPKMTCEEFAAHSTTDQVREAAWLDGYSKRGKPIDDVAEVDVERDVDAIVIDCKQTRSRLSGTDPRAPSHGRQGEGREDELRGSTYTSNVQGEVAYWLAGYHGARSMEPRGRRRARCRRPRQGMRCPRPRSGRIKSSSSPPGGVHVVLVRPSWLVLAVVSPWALPARRDAPTAWIRR